ncbi:MAG: hypothetical protein AAFO78_03425 [Pseudomonadota bacterium]
MPGFIKAGGVKSTYGIMRVSLKSGRGRVFKKGRSSTREWIVNEQGDVLATEEYNNKSDRYVLRAKRAGKLEVLVDVKSDIPPMSLVGIRADERALIVVNRARGPEYKRTFGNRYSNG